MIFHQNKHGVLGGENIKTPKYKNYKEKGQK